MYDILDHGMMVADERRMDAYLRAIRQVVRPGATVADIGAGTGVFSIAACAAGAARVYAIESDAVIALARTLAKSNGCDRLISFIQQRSTAVTLPERVDVIVMDVRGVLPDDQVEIAADARRRFLEPDGVVVPAIDTLWAAIVNAPDLFDRHADLGIVEWDAAGVDLRAARTGWLDRWSKCRVEPSQLASEPRCWATIDYGVSDRPPASGRLMWTIAESGPAHGLAAWFESVLAPGIELSNRPGDPPLLYGQRYFPWPRVVALAAGDRVSVEITSHACPTGLRWRWQTTIARADGRGSVTFDQPGADDHVA